MNEWFTDGRIVEWILLLIAAEAVIFSALVLIWRKRLPLTGLLLNLLAGACLLLALRVVLLGENWVMAAFWLGAAFVAHALDLLLRLRREPKRQFNGD